MADVDPPVTETPEPEGEEKKKKRKGPFKQHDCQLPRSYKDPFDTPMNPLKKVFLRAITISEHHHLNKTYMRSTNAFTQEKLRHIRLKTWWVVHPFSFFAGVWHSAMFIAYCIDLGNAPFYKNICDDSLLPLYIAYWIITFSVPCIFFFGYVDSNLGEIILDQKLVIAHYLRTWFLLDLLGAFPWRLAIYNTLVALGVEMKMINRKMRFLDMSRIFLFRLGYHHMRQALGFFRMSPSCYRIWKLVVIFLVFVHWSACMQSYIPFAVHGANLPYHEKSWMNQQLDEYEPKPIEFPRSRIYLASLFRTVTQILSQGYGVYFPEAREDAYFTMFIVLLGRVYYYYLIQEMLAYKEWVKSPKVKYYIMMGHVDQFMRRRQLPALMQRKIRMFYEYRFQKTYFKERQLMATMSDRLREEIRVHECRKLVEDSQLFGKLPPEAIDRVTRCFKQDVYLPNDVLIKVGNFGDCMFFLSRGTVAVISRSGEELVHLYDGAFFGELALISSEERRLATVIAIEISEVYRLERDDFQQVVRPMVGVFRQIRMVAEQRLQQMLEAERSMRVGTMQGGQSAPGGSTAGAGAGPAAAAGAGPTAAAPTVAENTAARDDTATGDNTATGDLGQSPEGGGK